MGNIVVLVILAGLVALCIRSMVGEHSSGGCEGCGHECNGSCGDCGSGHQDVIVTVKRKDVHKQ